MPAHSLVRGGDDICSTLNSRDSSSTDALIYSRCRYAKSCAITSLCVMTTTTEEPFVTEIKSQPKGISAKKTNLDFPTWPLLTSARLACRIRNGQAAARKTIPSRTVVQYRRVSRPSSSERIASCRTARTVLAASSRAARLSRCQSIVIRSLPALPSHFHEYYPPDEALVHGFNGLGWRKS